MSNMEWSTICDVKKTKRERSSDKRKRWEKLVAKYPHIITPQHANALQHQLNIEYLYDKLTSQEWIDLQCQGWKYVKVLKTSTVGTIEDEKNPQYEYYVAPLENPWSDLVLFMREN